LNAIISNLIKEGYTLTFAPEPNDEFPIGVTISKDGKEAYGCGADLEDAVADLFTIGDILMLPTDASPRG
jgi:hypothetical protein